MGCTVMDDNHAYIYIQGMSFKMWNPHMHVNLNYESIRDKDIIVIGQA